MKKLIKNPLFYLSSVLILVLAFQVVGLVRAAFLEPSTGFPTGSASAPLDTGSSEQTKFGILNIDVSGETPALRILNGGKICLPATRGGAMDCTVGAWDEIRGQSQWTDATNGIYYNAGNVSIGTTAVGTTYDLYVNGNAFAISGWESSDARLKKNINQLTGALDKLLSLRGVSYEWRTEEFPGRKLPNGQQLGLIAQEVEKIFPELVNTDNDGYKALAYDRLTAILLEAVKEQQVQINELTSRLQKLESLSN